jgi:hypothetical protein
MYNVVKIAFTTSQTGDSVAPTHNLINFDGDATRRQ